MRSKVKGILIVVFALIFLGVYILSYVKLFVEPIKDSKMYLSILLLPLLAGVIIFCIYTLWIGVSMMKS